MEVRRIPLGQKIAFGIGMLANQMFPAALSIFMVILVQSLGMSPFLWGLIFFLPKLVDCVTDPIMGFISDRTVSRWGMPHRDTVRSEMNPIIGSVTQSTSLGRKKIKPHRKGLIPKLCTSITIKILSAAGNIWFASMPMPNAIFCPRGIRLTSMVRYQLPQLLLLFHAMVATDMQMAGVKPVSGTFRATNGCFKRSETF